jgi:hypothetical protein
VSAPGLRLHKRTMPVQSASADFRLSLIKFQQEHDLTDVEVAQMLTETLQSVLKYVLQRERHPDDPDRKADEA